jgi:hypothetical protein
MKRIVLTVAIAIAASYALAQVGPMFPGPGGTVLNCTPNTQGGGTFANVVSLHHFDNNATDSSGNGHTGTLNGTASYTATTPKFGNRSYQGAASSSFTMNVFPANTGNFTVEMWVWMSALPGAFQLATDQGVTIGVLRYNAGGVQIDGMVTGSTKTSNFTPTADSTWHHYAWVRASNVNTFYLDGTARTMSGTDGTGSVFGGSNNVVYGNFSTSGSGGYAFTGRLDEARVSNMARYTANFTPATLAFCNS